MTDNHYIAFAMLALIAATALPRALPFILPKSVVTSRFVQQAAIVMPTIILSLLAFQAMQSRAMSNEVIFGLGKNEIVAGGLTVALQACLRNPLLSIIAGTACYMVSVNFFS